MTCAAVPETRPGPADGTAAGRTTDALLAVALAVLPLLPSGPSYIGIADTWWPEAWLLLLAGLALIVLSCSGSAHGSAGSALAGKGYAALTLVATGAMLVALAAEGAFGAALAAILDGSILRIFLPIDHALDPLYPVRVWLTAVEGALAFALVSLIVLRAADPERRRRIALVGCLAGMSLVGVVAIGQYLTRVNLHPYWVRMNRLVTRSHATLEDPNALGSFLVLGLGLAIGVWWASPGMQQRGRRLAALASVAIALPALFTSLSRSALMAFAAACGLMIAFGPDLGLRSSAPRRLARTIARALVIGTVMAAVLWIAARQVLPPEKPPRARTAWHVIVQTFDPRTPLDELLKGRLPMWRTAIEIFGHSPATGAGLGRYPRLYGREWTAPRPENAHNYFLQVLAEGGVAGAAGLGLFVMFVYAALMLEVRRRDAGPIAAGLGLGVTAFVLTWITGHPLLTVSNQLWLGCLLAIVLATPTQSAHTPADFRPGARLAPARRWTAIAVVAYVVLLIPAIGRATDVAAQASTGLHAWETGTTRPPGSRKREYRWTRKEAFLREPVRGDVLHLPIYLARPDLDRGPVVVELRVEGRPLDRFELGKNGWHVRRYDLRDLSDRSFVSIHVAVDRVFVPTDFGSAHDARTLGVALGPAWWQRASRETRSR